MRNAKITISELQLGQTQQKTRRRSKTRKCKNMKKKNSFRKQKNIYTLCIGILNIPIYNVYIFD